MGPNLLINGRFLTRAMTGVDRVAAELVRALAQVVAEDGHGLRIDIAVPRCTLRDEQIRATLGLPGDSRIWRSARSGHLWEQLVLPAAAPGAVLLSLCNTGPVLRRRQMVLIHDAQVFDVPQSYSAGFRLGYRLLLPLLGRTVRWLATVSKFSAGRLQANGVGSGREFLVLPNGADHMGRLEADPDALTRFGLTSQGYFLAVGSLAPHKNLAMLAEAMRLRTTDSVPLALVGSVDEGVFSRADDISIGGTQLLGRVSDGELKALYRGARALLLPSLTEGFGMSALEAMACGCPVVASTGGAIPEACGDAALYCDPRRPQEWAECCDRLAREPETAAELSRKGRERERQFRWKANARRLLRHLAEG